MKVSEDLPAVALPHVFPYRLRVHTAAVDEPLGVVIERNLTEDWLVRYHLVSGSTYVDFVRAAFLRSPKKRGQNGTGTGSACAEIRIRKDWSDRLIVAHCTAKLEAHTAVLEFKISRLVIRLISVMSK